MAHIQDTYEELTKLARLFTSIRFDSHSETECIAFQNSVHGPVIVSRHSSAILRHYVTDNPLVRLILSATQGHNDRYKDGGATLGSMICELLIRFYKTDYHPRMYSNVLSWCSRNCSELLQSQCEERFQITTDNITSMIHGILASKLSAYMRSCEMQTLTKQLAEVFIMTGGVQHVNTVGYVKGEATKNITQLHTGVMIDRHHSPVTLPAGCYTAVLVTCSLSGDTDEVFDVTYIGKSTKRNISAAILGRITTVIDFFAAGGVKLLICQKVVHPKVKLLLESRGMRYLERLGLTIGRLSRMTGIKSYESVTEKVSVLHSTRLNIIHTEHSGDIWLLVNNLPHNNRPTFTFRLCSWTEHITQDMENSCVQSLDAMQVLLTDTRLMGGGGAWQSALITKLEEKVRNIPSNEVRKMGSNVSSFRGIVEDFVSALQKRRLHDENDLTEYGAIPQVQDSLTASLAALTTAVSISNAIMLTGNVIHAS